MKWLKNYSHGKARSTHAAGLDIGPILNNTLGVLAGLTLLGLVAVTCVDVIGRYFFDAPLAGAFEITELMLAALVFTALPLTTERREHVEVDLLGFAFGPKLTQLLSAFAGLFSAALLATFSWRLFVLAGQTAHDGATTNALLIPLAPFGYLAAASTLISAFIAILRGVKAPKYLSKNTKNLEVTS